ncbi:MAG: hypothetical protein P1U87_20015, partial [Verrucomicrobiales bacterium]|nr:hypothetical protein [Verrucomicrobiales bacterium]
FSSRRVSPALRILYDASPVAGVCDPGMEAHDSMKAFPGLTETGYLSQVDEHVPPCGFYTMPAVTSPAIQNGPQILK